MHSFILECAQTLSMSRTSQNSAQHASVVITNIQERPVAVFHGLCEAINFIP